MGSKVLFESRLGAQAELCPRLFLVLITETGNGKRDFVQWWVGVSRWLLVLGCK